MAKQTYFLIINIVWLTHLIYTFEKKQKEFIGSFLWFNYVGLFFTSLIILLALFQEEDVFKYSREMGGFISSLIWMLYTKKSIRVKGTFIN